MIKIMYYTVIFLECIRKKCFIASITRYTHTTRSKIKLKILPKTFKFNSSIFCNSVHHTCKISYAGHLLYQTCNHKPAETIHSYQITHISYPSYRKNRFCSNNKPHGKRLVLGETLNPAKRQISKIKTKNMSLKLKKGPG